MAINAHPILLTEKINSFTTDEQNLLLIVMLNVTREVHLLSCMLVSAMTTLLSHFREREAAAKCSSLREAHPK